MSSEKPAVSPAPQPTQSATSATSAEPQPSVSAKEVSTVAEEATEEVTEAVKAEPREPAEVKAEEGENATEATEATKATEAQETKETEKPTTSEKPTDNTSNTSQQQPAKSPSPQSSDSTTSNSTSSSSAKHHPPQTVPASASQGGRELSRTILYVGNVHKSVAEDSLRELFSSVGPPIQSIKVLYDKNKPGFCYAFVEFDTHEHAENAQRSLNGSTLASYPLRITWAYKTQQSRNNNDGNTLFVGDLSPEVDDEMLSGFFGKFASFVQANVMWDMKTGRSRGYGFVSFSDNHDAETALKTMNDVALGGRPIRLNWAMHRTQNQGYQGGMGRGHRGMMGGFGGMGRGGPLHIAAGGPPLPSLAEAVSANGAGDVLNGLSIPGGVPGGVPAGRGPIISPQSYELVLRQAPNWLCAVYLGNLAHYTQQNDLIPFLQNFGYIVNFKLLPEKGCAFVTYDSHERAALAITQLSGLTINGRPLKSGWGKVNKVVRYNNNGNSNNSNNGGNVNNSGNNSANNSAN